MVKYNFTFYFSMVNGLSIAGVSIMLGFHLKDHKFLKCVSDTYKWNLLDKQLIYLCHSAGQKQQVNSAEIAVLWLWRL